MNKQTEKFNFFVPLSFEKGSLDKGDMKFKGVCSSSVVDTDGETLFPSGFNFQPLMEKGFINWNHQGNKTSAAIVGRPTKAQIINDGQDFYIEGALYKGVSEAKSIYELAQALENEDPNRRLGFSIEGRATERDIMNPKKILKAEITGVAITPCPKNPNTLLSIMKGEYSDPFIEEEESEEDKDKKEKAMTAEAGDNVTSVASVEHNPKDIVNKSEVYRQIIQKYDIDNIEKAKEIYNFVEQVNNKLFNMEGIISEGLQKAFEILNSQVELIKAKTSEEVEKSIDPAAKVEEQELKTEEEMKKSEDVGMDDVEKAKNEEVEKACAFAKENLEKGMLKDENIEDCIRKGVSLSVSQTAVEKVISEAEALKENGGGIEGVGGPLAAGIQKSLSDLETKVDNLIKSLSEGTLIKSEEITPLTAELIAPNFSEVTDLIKSQTEGLSIRFDSIGQILKSVVEDNTLVKSQLDELIIENGNLRDKISNIEKSSTGRKSVTTATAIDRFQKAEDNDPDNTYSLSNHNDVKALGNRLFEEYKVIKGRGRDDDELEKGIQNLEIAKSVMPEFIPRLVAMGIKVVK